MTNKIKEKKEEITSVYQGSAFNYMSVRATIKHRYGKKASKEYDPRKNCFTYKRWLQEGYQVKKGEKAIKSVTFIEADPDNPSDKRSFARNVNLFYKTQVELIK